MKIFFDQSHVKDGGEKGNLCFENFNLSCLYDKNLYLFKTKSNTPKKKMKRDLRDSEISEIGRRH